MKNWFFFYLFSYSEGCSSTSTTSKNGWSIDDLEDKILDLEAENDNLIARIADVEDSMTCPSGRVHDPCKCPSGSEFVPHFDDCVPSHQYRCMRKDPYNNWRLPTTSDGRPVAVPSHYDVDLQFSGFYESDKIDGNFFFTGNSTVTFAVNEDICSFHLQIRGVYEITSVEVMIGDAAVSASYSINAEYEYLTIFSDFTIPVNSEVKATVGYRMQMPTGTSGLYLAHYTNPEGEKRYLAATQFEPTNARTAFPCFDEPFLKATFKFSMKYKYKEYSAIFNTDIESQEVNGDWTTNHYYQTMRMPTYLLAILVSDFSLENKGTSNDGVEIRILGRKGWEEQSAFALQEAKSVVDAMSAKFDFPYCDAFQGMPCKSDQAGIPQFGAGAMENWGLITYREYYLFLDERRDSFLRKRSATSIIGHELMHMWFGNKVSCPWWDEIYINEAFGSIGGYLGLIYGESNNEIDYQWEDEYLYGQTYSGLLTDGTTRSRPMVNNANNGRLKVETPAEAGSQFDGIAYDKSGSIMLLIRAMLGDDLWTAGLRDYLKGQQFGSAHWNELLSYWDGVLTQEVKENLNGQTITEIMEPYFRQMGYPVLKIKSGGCNPGYGCNYNITTHRYLQEGPKNDYQSPTSEFGYKWQVPLFINEMGEERIHWLDDAGENDGFNYVVPVQDGGIFNPNGNMWARLNFDRTYIQNLVDGHWNRGENWLLARNIAKMFQDHYRMLISEHLDEFDVSVKTLLDLTWLVRGPESDQIDGDKNRWIIWRELDRMNVFGTLHNRLASYLQNADDESAEGLFFESYMDYMYSKIDFVDLYYPDKSVETDYDISKARMTEFVVSMATKYANQRRPFFKNAHDLAMLTVDGVLEFLDQSPDTRTTTFKAAVAYESHQTESSVVTFLTQQISDAVNDAVDAADIRACTNKDVTNVIVPLYTGDCMLNTYFVALASSEDLTKAMRTKNDLPLELQGDYLVNLAGNSKINRALVSEFQNMETSDIESELTPNQLNAFIRNGCAHLSTLTDKETTAQWEMINFSVDYQTSVNDALYSCNFTWIDNNNFMKEHYQHVQDWFCESGQLDCSDLLFEIDQFEVAHAPFNSWYLPRNENDECIYQPSLYEVSLDFDGLKEEDKDENGDFFFRGVSTVNFVNSERLDSINIHVDLDTFMTIQQTTVFVGDTRVNIAATHHNNDYRLFTVYLARRIPPNSQVRLTTRYVVKLTTSTEGLYLSSFVNSMGQTEYLTATQFESTHAREAFPCFDEPALKAAFDFKMQYRYRDEFTAIYNTDVKSYRNIGADSRENTYYRTVKMSTYLNAVLVSTFNVEALGTSDLGTAVRILGRDDFKDETDFALNEALSIVDNFSRYFDYEYCGPIIAADNHTDVNELKCKSDQTGIPTFRSGAMENWGLITYREYYLHYDDRRDPFLVRRTATRIIGHELIHQWFGNLVTCGWWDEIYINEAWGSIGGYLGMFKAGSMAEVDYAWEEEYLTTQTYGGLDFDGRLTSRPMVNNMNNGPLRVDTPGQIRSQFDSIAYNKAGSVMMMIREVIGENLWITGLQNYLKGQQLDVANWKLTLEYWDQAIAANPSDPDNLLDPNAGTLLEIFEPYFKQMGYPIVYVNLLNEDESTITYQITTERFLNQLGDKNMPASVYEYKWDIPIVIKTENGKAIRWLKDMGNTGITHHITLDKNSILDPNGNTWLRMKHDGYTQGQENYVEHAIRMHWDTNLPSVTGSNIGKMMQDTYAMLQSPRIDYQIQPKYTDLLQMTWLIRGREEDQVDTNYKRWIVFRELENDLSGRLYNMMMAALIDSANPADAQLLDAYRNYFARILDNTIYRLNGITNPDGVYPDKQPEDWDNISNTFVFDVKKARMAPYIARLALQYMDYDSDFFVWASQLAGLTAANSVGFEDQSPDTRPYTFQAAVVCESKSTCTGNTVTNYLITEIGKVKAVDFFCSSTQLSYPLYSTPAQAWCRYHRYWDALKQSRDLTHVLSIQQELQKIDPTLGRRFMSEVSGNVFLASALLTETSGYPSSEVLDIFNYDDSMIQTFIENACRYFSTSKQNELLDRWSTMHEELMNRDAIAAAIQSCKTRRTANSIEITQYFDEISKWICQETLQGVGCDGWQFDGKFD